MRATSSRPTRTPARWCGTRTSPIRPISSSPPRRSPSRTRSWSAAPAAIAACAAGSRRSIPRPATIKWKTYSIPAPGEPGSETWKDKVNAWQTGGGSFYGTGAYDPANNLTYWGSGNPVPAYDISFRPGDNLYTSSAIAFNAGERQDHLVAPVHAERQPRLRRDRRPRPDRYQDQRRGPQDPLPCGPQRLHLQLRPPQRPVPQGHPARQGC